MIFYNALSNYHILTCILHKLKYHSKEPAILGIPNYHKSLSLIKNNLEKFKFFDQIIVIEEFNWHQLNESTQSSIKKDIELITKKFSAKNNLDFKQFKEINICGDHNSIGIYLTSSQIKYNFFEDGCGVLSEEDRLMNQFRKTNYHRYKILKQLGIPGNNQYVKNRYGDLNCQIKDYYNKKDIHFSVREELEKLDKNTIKNIINVFDSKFQFQIKNNSDLLLTWHYISAGMMKPLEQEHYYCIMLDYFSKNKHIIIKPHPADDELDYLKIFPKVNIISRTLPSELLPYCSTSKFNNLITGNSTSINGLKKYTNNIIDFNSEYDQSYKKMNKYFTAAKLLEKISFENKKINIYGLGINSKQLQNTLKSINLDINIQKLPLNNLNDKHNIIIIDDIEYQNIEKLINSNNILIIINDNIISNFHFNNTKLFPIIITKHFINDKFKKLEPFEEFIWIYNFDKIFTILEKLKFTKQLNYSGITLNANTSKQTPYLYILKYYHENHKLEELTAEKNKLINELNIIKNSKGYKILTKYWSFINKIK